MGMGIGVDNSYAGTLNINNEMKTITPTDSIEA
jgi:hypothetical protein